MPLKHTWYNTISNYKTPQKGENLSKYHRNKKKRWCYLKIKSLLNCTLNNFLKANTC